MRLSPVIVLIAALVAALIVGVVVVLAVQPPRPLLYNVSVSQTVITPGSTSNSAAIISYTLSRNAAVTIMFQSKANAGNTYTFRAAEPRAADTFRVQFSGIVDGYTLPGEKIDGTVLSRLLPNGDYTWTIRAVDDKQQPAQATGTITINSPDSALPLIQTFSVSPTVFTPNQDGVDDRVEINTYLSKPATLTVYLQAKDGTQYDIPEHVEIRQPDEAGAHIYDYDGGIDNNVTPPPNGDYTVVAVAQDLEGQMIRRTASVTLKDGGLPQVEIKPQTVGNTLTWGTLPFTNQPSVQPPPGLTANQSTITLQQGDLLTFSLYVYNYGPTPIRTIGPWPGAVYDYQQTDSIFTNTEKTSRSGAWRIGLQCETSETSLPWRWAVGSKDQLTAVTDDKGDTFYYLEPGQSTIVWGAIRMSRLITTRNPQQCWASLIHEDVAIPPLQSNLGAISVALSPISVTPAPTAAVTQSP